MLFWVHVCGLCVLTSVGRILKLIFVLWLEQVLCSCLLLLSLFVEGVGGSVIVAFPGHTYLPFLTDFVHSSIKV